jgi:thiamine pyrophosphate-dependent acetolactate synthase large subunit-like protein
LLERRGELLVVAGLGAPAWDVTAAGDHPLTFPMWGAMGGAAMMGLGLALAQPRRRVLVVTGDGEMLMGLGSLATIAVQRPRNLVLVVLDNERYGETGMQKTHTAYGVDLAGMAKAAGFPRVLRVTSTQGVARLAAVVRGGGAGPVFAQVKVLTEKLPLVLPPKDGVLLKARFRAALAQEKRGRFLQ